MFSNPTGYPRDLTQKRMGDKMGNKIRIVAIDDHHFVRRGIISSLEHDDQLEVVGEGSSGEELWPLIEKHNPDVLLLDIQMPESNPPFSAIDAVVALQAQYPDLTIIIVTAGAEASTIQSLTSVGIQGIIYKTDAVAAIDLDKKIKDVHSGLTYFSPEIINILKAEPLSPVDNLSSREREVITVLIEYTHLHRPEQAELLRISQSTMYKHTKSIQQALNATTIENVIAIGIRQQLSLPRSQWYWLDSEDNDPSCQ